MNYVSKENMADILDGIARKIGTGGTGSGLEDWQAEHEYIEKDICVYEGQIYRAKVGFTSDTTFSTTQILEEYTPVGGETIIPYEKDTEINIDDIVSYDNNTYKALYNFVCGEEFSLYALEEYVPQELTDDDIKEIVGAYNPVFEEAKGIEYSTEERRIGTWIDGKPLYQITLGATSPATVNTPAELSDLPQNVNPTNVKDIKGILYSSSEYIYGVNHYFSATDMIGVWVRPNRKICAMVGNEGCTNCDLYITIQYTKTTDGGGT